MNKILESPRLYLREFSLMDAPALYELNSDPMVIQYTGDPPFQSVDTAEAFIKSYDVYQKLGFGRWAVILKSNGQFIGWCGFKKHEEGWIDLGFRFFRKHWNQGFATEAAQACLYYGFQKLNFTKVVGRAARVNTASIRVLEKIGMIYWKDAPCDGIQDAVYYEIKK